MKILKDPMFWIAIVVGFLLSIIAAGRHAHSECYHTASEAREAHEAPYAAWSRHVHGHRGDKCWYVPGWKNRELIASAPLPPARPAPIVKPSPVELPPDSGWPTEGIVASAHALFTVQAPAPVVPAVLVSAYAVPSSPVRSSSSLDENAMLSAWLRASIAHARIVTARVLESP